MPTRVARSSVASAKPRTKRKRNQKRALDAFSIATAAEPERHNIRQHRLGESEGDDFRRKRRRVGDGDEDAEDSDAGPSGPRRKQQRTLDGSDVDEGSDSEGNTWRMGEVDDDDDSDLDSDEAFGESDEERFEGFTFRGSSSNKKTSRRAKKPDVDDEPDIGLDEGDDPADAEGEYDDDSLGDDAVDLATMLDNYESEDGDESGSGREEAELDEESLQDADEVDGLSKLDAFVSSLPINRPGDDTARQARQFDPSARPGESAGRPKLSMDAFLNAEKSLKEIIPSFKQAKKYTNAKSTEVPLPERQRAKLERAAADKKARETLERWVDTVKQNRRAEHLTFPLSDTRDVQTLGARKLLSSSRKAPATELESAIANIMQESGLASSEKDAERQVQEFEELQMNKMPIEDVEARRAALRQARDLMFREEIRAKRVKKIKSKAYRRVHRKERERQALRDADIFGEGEMDEEERQRLDRRRAEERMGAKHRDSKWAKAIKRTGQAAWDEDARDGVTEMARRNEELRRRQLGKNVADSDASSASEEESDISDDEAARDVYKTRLEDLSNVPSGGKSALSEMKFMKNAEAAKRAQNEEDIERLRRELNGEDPFETSDEDNEHVVGRKKYGPQAKQANFGNEQSHAVEKSEFEERAGASSDEEVEIIVDKQSSGRSVQTNGSQKAQKQKAKPPAKASLKQEVNEVAYTGKAEQNPFLAGRKSRGKKQPSPSSETETLPGEIHSKPDTDGWITVSYDKETNDDASSNASDNDSPPTLSRNEQLIQQAFAGDYTAEDFAREKRSAAAEDDDQVVDAGLPGWGSWAGAGLTRREQRHAAARKAAAQTVRKGVKPADRRDARLANVIVSEKRVKKNGAYLAAQLPFPYATREEYERSMRMPVGGEWNTKMVVQANVKPRVIVKPGRVIKPIEAPMV